MPRWDYRLHRRLSFADEETVLAEYVIESHAEVPLPIHWAQHPVLKVEPGSYIDLPEVIPPTARGRTASTCPRS